LKRIINEPRRKIGEVTLNAVESIADETGRSMFEVMREAYRHIALARSAHILVSFAEMIDGLRKMLDDGCPLDAFVTNVLERSGYRQMLIDGGEAEKDRLDNVDEFVSGVIEYMKNNEEPTLTGFLEETALVADVDRFDETADAVVLMTIHSAKGLEFPVAIIPGLEEGIFPGMQSQNDPSELEEERRLAYVAITRAKRELFLFHSDRRLLYGRTMYNPISRFVEDIPTELIEEKTKPKKAASEFSWGDYSSSPKSYMGGGTGGNMRPVQRPGTVPTVKKPTVPTTKTTPMKKPAVFFEPGDRVKHPAFGEGEVISAKQMGSDTLYEVIFDNVGTKKLMATYAKLTKA
jgi:DNA helicase-2/ATP-dependent DNA helicase PcrA